MKVIWRMYPNQLFSMCFILMLINLCHCVLYLEELFPDIHINKSSSGYYSQVVPISQFRSSDDSSFIGLSLGEESPGWIVSSPVFEEVMEFETYTAGDDSPSYLLKRDDHLFVFDNQGLLIFDVSDRSNPTLITVQTVIKGGFYSYFTVNGIEGDFLFFSVNGFGFFIFDISSIANPVEIFRMKDSKARAMFLAGDYGYLIDLDGYVMIIDMTSPDKAVIKSLVIEDLSDMYRLRVHGDYVFISTYSSGKLVILSIVDKQNPLVIGSITVCPYCDHLFVTEDEQYCFVSSSDSTMKIIDVGDKTSPELVTAFEIGGYSWDLFLDYEKKHLYVLFHYLPMEIYDISGDNVTSPVLIETYKTSEYYSYDVIASDNLAFLSTNRGVEILDMASTSGVTLLSKAEVRTNILTPSANERYVVSRGQMDSLNNRAFSIFERDPSDFQSMRMVHLSVLDDVYFLHRYFTFAMVVDYIVPGETYLFRARNSIGLEIFNITGKYQHSPISPLNSSLIGELKTSDPDWFFLDENTLPYVYIADSNEGGIKVADISDISNPVIVKELPDPGGACGFVVVRGEYAFFCCRDGGMKILDVSNPPETFVVSTLEMGDAYRVALWEQYAYVINRGSGLVVVDISDVLNPVEVKELKFPYIKAGVVVAGDFLLVNAQGEDAVSVYDLATNNGGGGGGGGANPKFVGVLMDETYKYSDISTYGNAVFIGGERFLHWTEFGNLKIEGNIPQYSQYCGKTTIFIEGKEGSSGDILQTSFDMIFDEYANEEICGGHGHCVPGGYNCVCDDGYSSPLTNGQCTEWNCDSEKYYDANVCSGNGVCVNPDECECLFGFSGDKCETHLIALYLTIIVPSLIIFCGCCCIFSCALVLLVSCCILSVIPIFLFLRVFFAQSVGLVKYKRLKNFDILLQEQMLDETGEHAHLEIRIEKFKIEFDKVKVISTIGEGGSSAIVFKALWEGKIVAFKVFKTRFLYSTQDEYDDFEAEVTILSSISHPHVIRFFGCSVNPPRVGILMEYCENGEIASFFSDYKDQMSGKRYPYSEKIRMVKEIVSAMKYLHGRAIIHRDLKCENILVDAKETTRVMDFGLSRFLEKNVERQKMTQRVGTSIYMAPEIVSSDTYDEKCDVFSFGITVWVMMTENANPYQGGSMNIQYRVAKDPSLRPSIEELQSIEEENKEKWIAELVQRCWAHDPLNRPSFQQIQDEWSR